jgi:hypothetical protein
MEALFMPLSRHRAAPKKIKRANTEDLKTLAVNDLERSGLSAKDFKTLGLEILTADQTDDYVGEPRASYRIPYFDLSGKRTAYSRVRFLENHTGRAFKKGGSFRYSQPFNSSPHLYYPPYLDWKKIAKDPSIPILLTEGEKKAAKACKEGIACIALGGVYGYKSSKRLQDLIPEFYDVVWKDREVEICYDADVMMKSEVRQALSGIAFELSQKFTPEEINFVFLDAETVGPKTGLDDFLVAHGVDEFRALPRHPYRTNSKIQMLNQRLCYVERVGRFYDIKTRRFYGNFNHVREAFMNAGEEIVDGKRTALVIDLWGRSNNRRAVRDVTYAPGVETETTEDNDLNIWVPPVVRAKRGSPRPWLDLVHYVMRKPEYATWFLKWLAYPVQNPGAKLLTAVFVHGAAQGVGKTFVVDPVMEFVYGERNFYRLSNDDLQSAFNAYAGHTQFVVTNEIYFTEARDRRTMMSRLKDMITREKVTVNEKFQPKMTFTDYCNYYFTSNHADALILEPRDRRFFVIEAPEDKLDPGAYADLDRYVREQGGASEVLHYLRHSVDLSDFNPKEAALHTPYKDALVDLSKDVVTEFAEKLIEEPEHVFMHDGHLPDLQLFRAEDIVKLFEVTNPRHRYPITANRMGRLLNDSRLERRKVRIGHDAPQTVLYAMFDRDTWHARKNREWAEHYQQHHRRYGKSRLN